MLSALDKEQYWRTVEACLVEILGMDAAEAYQKVLELRLNIAKGFQGESLDIAYHNEPLKVAVDLAGYELGQFDFLAHKDQYATIRERYMPIGGNQILANLDDYFQFARGIEGVVSGEIPLITFPLDENRTLGVVPRQKNKVAQPREPRLFVCEVPRPSALNEMTAKMIERFFSQIDNDFEADASKKKNPKTAK
jgi:hypothetical protein